MNSLCKRRSLVNILILMVMWFNALAPVLSHAVTTSNAGDDSFTVICTSTGTKLVKIDTGSVDASQNQNIHSDGHCLICAQHTSIIAIPCSQFQPDFTFSSTGTFSRSTDNPVTLSLKWPINAARAPPNLI